MKLENVTVRFVVMYLKMGQLAWFCVSTQFHPQRYKHEAGGELNLTRAAVLTNELIK